MMNSNGNDTQRRAKLLAERIRKLLERLQDNTTALERLEEQGKTSIVIVERE